MNSWQDQKSRCEHVGQRIVEGNDKLKELGPRWLSMNCWAKRRRRTLFGIAVQVFTAWRRERGGVEGRREGGRKKEREETLKDHHGPSHIWNLSFFSALEQFQITWICFHCPAFTIIEREKDLLPFTRVLGPWVPNTTFSFARSYGWRSLNKRSVPIGKPIGDYLSNISYRGPFSRTFLMKF